MTVYPLHALRAVALWTQGLDAPNGTGHTPGRDDLYRCVTQVGCVQIDTLHMVRRSQYLVPWSRLGSYDPADFDALASAADRRLFEGEQHAACFIPLNEYRYQMPRQRGLRENPDIWYAHRLSRQQREEIVAAVRGRIDREGALRVSDFESDGRKGGSWWN